MDRAGLCRLKCEELRSRLKRYQWDNVEAVTAHLQRRKRTLLADEVGLGKTEVARGVLARLAERHCETQERPFRVAYVCPNLHIAKQNMKKLALFSEGENRFQQNAAFHAALEQALQDYQDGLDPADRSSVYTRLCEWLLALCEGKAFGISDHPNDWKRSRNRDRGGRADRLREACIQAVEGVDRELAAVMRGAWASVCGRYGVDAPVKRTFAFNRQLAECLSGFHEDQRLSMQHLYSAEAERLRGNSVMQLDLLTPRTSILPPERAAGTMAERALLQASCERVMEGQLSHGESADLTQVFLKVRAVDRGRYEELLSGFRRRIRGVALGALPEWPELAPCFSGRRDREGRVDLPSLQVDFARLRGVFIAKNLESMQYDLAVLDEFQNYTEILSWSGRSGSEADQIVQRLLGGDTRVLLLSATPFACSGAVLEQIRDMDEGEDGDSCPALTRPEQFGEEFDHLMRFMGEGQEAGLQTPADAGIFRTTRGAAAAHPPIIEGRTGVIQPDFFYALRVNQAGIGRCQARYSWSTPYALTFSYGYRFNRDCGEEDAGLELVRDRRLFLSPKMLSGRDSIPAMHPGFEAMRRELVTERSACMLWIPPCRCSRPLAGAFEGMEGFSKTLIFCNYRMTPRAFAYLLSHEAYRHTAERSEEDWSGVREVVQELVHRALAGEEGSGGVPLTERALVELFEGIFCGRGTGGCGPQAVRRFYGAVPSYAGAVRRYCEDGCFEDMIREYAALLAGEHGERDEEMAKAVEWAAACQQPKARLTLWDDAQDGPRWYELAPSSSFAAGLYATNREGTNGERRLAEIKNAFNAPIQPFVFATTSIGTEGIDLHWYARNVVHWSVPSRPADLEQREGRVLRYQCHAVRLNEALIREGRVQAGERDCVREAYLGSGMYPAQLSFFSDEERSPQSPEGCWHVRRYRYFTPFSWEAASYAEAERAIQSYQELLRRLQTAPSGRG